jgi:hypothetical protein
MTKEEYTKTLEKHMAKVADSKYDDYYAGCFDGLRKAIDLAKKLNEPKKVVIPQFAADWITKTKANFTDEPLYTAEVIANAIDEGTDYHFDWLEDVENQKLLLNAIANGYEVEEDVKKEKMYRFNIPTAYKCLYDTGKEVAILPYVCDGAKSAMTMKRAKTWTYFNAYNNAGLLEFEEVEDE